MLRVPAVKYAVIRGPFISPAHLNKLGVLAPARGVQKRRGGLLRHVAFFSTLGNNGKTTKLFFFFNKIGRMLKPPVPKFCHDLSDRLKDTAEKGSPRS